MSPEPNGDFRLVARSPAMRRVADLLDRVAARSGGVTLAGEPGSGRSFVARIIHARAAPPGAPFVELDCGLVDPSHLAWHLFGTGPIDAASDFRTAAGRAAVPGRTAAGRALNGFRPRRAPAPASRVLVTADSLVARARGGTLFLANLHEMPDRDQARLARLLRDGEVATGDPAAGAVPLDTRLMAATNGDFDEALRDGRVRADLNRHLAGTRLHVPPLRERRKDIPDLAALFLQEACAAARLPPKLFTDPVVSILTALPYPGNARELRALVDTLVLRATGPVVHLENLLDLLDFSPSHRGQTLGGTLREARDRFERQYILTMLEQHKGRVGDAAAALGIQRTNLYRKMRGLGIATHRARE